MVGGFVEINSDWFMLKLDIKVKKYIFMGFRLGDVDLWLCVCDWGRVCDELYD